jgi:glucose-6-phosphate 1-epimerase
VDKSNWQTRFARFEILGRVTFQEGQGELPLIKVRTPWSTAEIYLHGAQITHFQKNGEPPLLFLSRASRFAADQPIRGGIPIVFPWFGRHADKPNAHGFARLRNWELKEVASAADGSVSLRFAMPECQKASDCPACAVDYVVAVSDALGAELIVTNKSATDFVFENCLHTYFAVGDINAVSIIGLKGVDYLDAVAGFARKTENCESIRIDSEVDRIYLNTAHTVGIHDSSLRRKIRVAKEGSASTVVWNPWITKAKAVGDFGDEEYTQMVCVESGNVALNRIALPPGQTARLKIKLSTEPLR